MKKHILRIRKIDKIAFDSIKNKKKIIETRAATDKFRKIEKDDILVFVCEDKRLEKQIKQVKLFESIDKMLEKIDFKKIMPFINSADEMKKVYYSFSGYKEKIDKFGLIAFLI